MKTVFIIMANDPCQDDGFPVFVTDDEELAGFLSSERYGGFLTTVQLPFIKKDDDDGGGG